MPNEHLAIYLHDHRAGAVAALDLLEQLERDHAGPELAGFYARLGRTSWPTATIWTP